jgi:type II secretory pathway pseudopilin PulG
MLSTGRLGTRCPTVRRRASASRHSGERGEAGMTLAELVVASALTIVIGTMATTFFVAVIHTTSRVTLANQQTGDARATLDSWTSLLRLAGWLDPNTMADRFEELTPTKIVFYANLNNRGSADQTVGAPTKVALFLDDGGAGTGQLVEIVFQADNTTPRSVRQLGFEAAATNGSWIFTPYNRLGGAVDTSALGCQSGQSAVTGLCLKAPTGAGLLDPQFGPATHAVVSGPLRGNGSADATLQSIGRIDIAFTVSGPANTAAMDYASSASVSSGFSS